MKRFLLNGLVLFVLLLIANLILFQVVHRVYLDEYEKVETKFSTYVLSDSHGVPLKQLPGQLEFYNFSAVSDSYIDMERKLSFLISNSNVKRILITVDDHTLSPYREYANNSDRSVFFAGLKNYPNRYNFFKDKYLRYNVIFFNSKYQSLLKPYLIGMIFRIAKAAEKQEKWSELSEDERDKLSSDRFIGLFQEKHKSEILKNSLEKIISICQSNNIELIGVKYPISESYLLLMGNRSYNAEELFLEHGLRVLDFKNHYIKRNDFFENQDHLNFEGGRSFFQYLITTL